MILHLLGGLVHLVKYSNSFSKVLLNRFLTGFHTFEEETDERTSLLTDSVRSSSHNSQESNLKSWHTVLCYKSIPWVKKVLLRFIFS